MCVCVYVGICVSVLKYMHMSYVWYLQEVHAASLYCREIREMSGFPDVKWLISDDDDVLRESDSGFVQQCSSFHHSSTFVIRLIIIHRHSTHHYSLAFIDSSPPPSPSPYRHRHRHRHRHRDTVGDRWVMNHDSWSIILGTMDIDNKTGCCNYLLQV